MQRKERVIRKQRDGNGGKFDWNENEEGKKEKKKEMIRKKDTRTK